MRATGQGEACGLDADPLDAWAVGGRGEEGLQRCRRSPVSLVRREMGRTCALLRLDPALDGREAPARFDQVSRLSGSHGQDGSQTL
jgi:hypothetical protein